MCMTEHKTNISIYPTYLQKVLLGFSMKYLVAARS